MIYLKTRMNSKTDGESGVVMILLALLLTVIFSFVILALGLGFLATEKSRMQAIANMTTLAAIEQYIRTPKDSNSEPDRRVAALERANFLFSKNKLHGVQAALGGIDTAAGGDGGRLRFGLYHRETPNESTQCSAYPCFEEVAATAEANAVMLRVQNQPTNPIVRPFKGIMGQEEFNIHETVYATLINSCVGHLLDVSVSTVSGAHKPYRGVCLSGSTNCTTFWGLSRLKIKEPVVYRTDPITFDDIDFSTASLFAYDAAKIFDNPTAGTGPKDCTSSAVLADNSPDLTYWCNMYDQRQDWVDTYNGSAVAPDGMYFKSDYVLQQVFKGSSNPDNRYPMMLINKRKLPKRPSPMEDFFLGANMALRVGEKLPSESNKGFFWAFTGTIANRAYPPRKDTDGDDVPLVDQVTSDLGFMTQLTDMDLIGDVNSAGVPDNADVEYPNLLDFGFFPMDPPHVGAGDNPIYAAANLPMFVFQAAEVLSTACDDSSRRSIFLYTDGIGTCQWVPGGAEFTLVDGVSADCHLVGGDAWPNYVASEYAILHELIPFLQSLGISVTVFFDGPFVNPNFKNIADPEHADSANCAASSDYNCFLDFTRAHQAGYRGIPPRVGTWNDGGSMQSCGDTFTGSFYDCSSTIDDGTGNPISATDEDAFRETFTGGENVTFGRAIGVMSELALSTGGVFCPLMSPGNVTDYIDHDNDFSDSGNGCPDGDPALCCERIFNGDPLAEGKTPCRLKNSSRTGGVENRSLEFVPKGFQSALCAQRALELNPFTLVEPIQVKLN